MLGFLKRLFGGSEAAQARAESAAQARAEDEGSVASASVFVSNDPSKGVSLEQAAEMQREVLEALDDSNLPVSQKMNEAAKLLTGGAFRESIAAFERIMRLHPERTADCLGNMGAAYFFLDEFETAIDHYQRARDAGADAGMMADNIQEAEEAIAKRDGAAS